MLTHTNSLDLAYLTRRPIVEDTEIQQLMTKRAVADKLRTSA